MLTVEQMEIIHREIDGARSHVTLLAWREAGMSDERWSRLIASHEAEILLLRARIEEST